MGLYITRLRRVVAFAVVACVAATVAATAAAVHIPPPAAIVSAKQIVFCNDPTYPPLEFTQGSKIVGADADIAAQIGKLFGVKAQLLRTQFDSIIPALLSNKCDSILSGLGINPARAKVVNFVPYSRSGNQLVVLANNPAKITGYNKSLAGKLVGNESGSVDIPALQRFCKTLSPACKVVLFPGDTDAADALLANKIDTYEEGLTAVPYRLAKAQGRLKALPGLFDAFNAGIAVPKNDPQLKTALTTAVQTLYRNRMMCTILAKWKIASAALAGRC